jgi:hypothetical protein
MLSWCENAEDLYMTFNICIKPPEGTRANNNEVSNAKYFKAW